MKLFQFFFISFCVAACNNNAATKEKNNDSANENNQAVVENIVPAKMAATDIPAECKITGNLNEAWQWKDKLGDNLLITSVVPAYYEKKKRADVEESQAAALYAVHYIKKGDKYEPAWNMDDAEKGCEFDITTEFLNGATTITDLDHNGIAETKLQYALACRSDVSPAYMKLVMYEGDKKYTLKGLRWIKTSPDEEFKVTENTVNLEKIPRQKDDFDQWLLSCGRYETEKDFVSAPPEFLPYARTEWLKYAKETMGEEN